jgi:hypothetical protein
MQQLQQQQQQSQQQINLGQIELLKNGEKEKPYSRPKASDFLFEKLSYVSNEHATVEATGRPKATMGEYTCCLALATFQKDIRHLLYSCIVYVVCNRTSM